MLEKFKGHNVHFKLLIYLWPFLWSRDDGLRSRFIWTFLIILGSTALSIMVPLFFKKIIDLLNISVAFLTADFQSKPEMTTFWLIGLYGLVWTLTRISITAREMLMFRVMERGVMRLSAHLFQHLHSLSFQFHIKRKTGEITSIIEKAQMAFPGILWPLFFLIIPTFLEIIVVSMLLSNLYGWTYGAIMLGSITFFLAFTLKILNWSLGAFRLSNEKHYQCNSNIVDSLINFATIKLFNTQATEMEKCKSLLKSREDAMMNTLMRSRVVSLAHDIIIGLILTTFMLMTTYKLFYEQYTVSDFILINSYILQFSIPLASLGFVLKNFREQLTHMEKIIDLLNTETIFKNGKELLQVENQQLSISCKNIYFEYEAKRPILKDISFDLLPGKILGIVGPTGSGKSTISNLLLRFFECQHGQILINNQDIKQLKQESLLKYVGIVPQDIVLFNDSLKNNLIYGNLEASDEMLKQVIHLSLLDNLINDLPEGLETIVGERGLTLSTGEKQKIGLARVLLKQPLLYIFDEATSSLDVETEQRIMQNIKEMTKNATVLIIAHRLSTVRSADEILVLQHGTIVERGSHMSLLQKKGLYTRLHTTQVSTPNSAASVFI